MNDSSSATESEVPRGVAARTGLVPHVPPAVGLGLRRLDAPHIFGGVIIGAAAAAYFALRRSTKTRTSSERPAAHTSPMMRMVDGLSAVAVPKRSSPYRRSRYPSWRGRQTRRWRRRIHRPNEIGLAITCELLKAAVKLGRTITPRAWAPLFPTTHCFRLRRC